MGRKKNQDPVDRAVAQVLDEKMLEQLDEEYEAVTAGMAQEDLDVLEGPNLYLEFSDDGSLRGWAIDYPDYYQGHGGPVAVVFPGGDRDDLRREIEDTLVQYEVVGNPNGYGDFARRHGITMTCESLDGRTDVDFPPGSHHYKCRLKRGKRSMQVKFSMGPALEGPPSVEDVLHSLAMDAMTWESVSSAEELADELGFDDPKEARRVWKAIESQTGRLQRLLDDDELYEELIYHVQENPIGNPVSPRMRAALTAGAVSLGGLILGGALLGGFGAWMGSIAGGAAGGYVGASAASKQGGTVGGLVGGSLGPLGAGVGTYIGTYQENPDSLVVLAEDEEEAERRARKFGRVVGAAEIAPGRWQVVVAPRANPAKLTVKKGRR